MRVTDSMIFQQGAADAAAAAARAQDAANQASTGLKLAHPGDDPGGAGLVALNDGIAARATAIGSAAGQAADELGAADGALNSVTNALARAQQIATQFGSAGYSAQQRSDAALEVQGLTSSIVASLNTKVGNRYIFGGTLDNAEPFNAAGTYLGDANVRKVEVAPGVLQDASVRADVALKGVGGGTDVLATLNQLATDLSNNNQAGVASALTGLTAGTDQVAAARAQAGTDTSALDTAVTVNQAAHDQAVAASSKLTDADPIQANSDLALAQRALEASLTATASTFKLTLLNYLTTT
jgi:flagellar hook-associated protein 3 FlgL